MKINIYNQDIYFDEVPENVQPNQKIFISNLLWLNETTLPDSDSTIEFYTSYNLHLQLRSSTFGNNILLAKANFTCLQPYEETQISLGTGLAIDVLMCDSPKEAANVIYLLKNNNKIEHFYAGVFTFIREAAMKETFCKWLKLKVNTIYIHQERIAETVKSNEISNITNTIKDLFATGQCSKLVLWVPHFGYENLVEQLSIKLSGMVSTLGTYLCHYDIVSQQKKYLAKNWSQTKIMVVSEKVSKLLTLSDVAYIEVSPFAVKEEGVQKLQYSPYPNAVQIEVLINIVRPQKIMGIKNGEPSDFKVPTFLKKFCTTFEKPTEKEQKPTKVEVPKEAQVVTTAAVEVRKEVTKESVYTLKKKTVHYLDDNDED